MKRVSVFLLICTLLFALALPAFAAERTQRLEDGANLLTDNEASALLSRLNDLSETLQFDVVIVTATSIGSRTPEEFADDYFDYNGFGYGVSNDGCLLLVSMADRDWHVSTSGFGITALDSGYFIDYLRNCGFVSDLSDGDYADAFHTFADLVDDFVTKAQNGTPYGSAHRYHDTKSVAIGVLVSLLIGVVISGVITFGIYKRTTAAVRKKHGAANYLVDGSMHLTQQSDHFLYHSMHRTRREPESSSGSGGGTHVSSSGNSHGGGGGKF